MVSRMRCVGLESRWTMAEYVVKSAEPNETVLHGWTPNGYESWDWLPVREEIVRCRDCKHYDEIIHACNHPCITALRGDCPENWIFSCFDNDFCAWGKRREEDK